MSGSDGEGKEDTCYIPKSKAEGFMVLFAFIKNKLGSRKEAMDYVGIGCSTLYRLKNESVLSRFNARKILKKYKELKKWGEL